MVTSYDVGRMHSKRMARWRIHNLGLSGSRFKTPQEVVKWLCAVQSQDYGPAKWSVAERIPGVDDAAIRRRRPKWPPFPPRDERPLAALAAGHNIGSIRVPQKCGFTVSGKEPRHAEAEAVEEVCLVLRARDPRHPCSPARGGDLRKV